MTNDTEATESTKPSKTAETTRLQHLNRLEALERSLFAAALDVVKAGEEAAGAQDKYLQAESLRWIIERERKRNLLPILEPVEEKPFVLTED